MSGDFFDRLIDALERTGVSYMLTGSYASGAYGVPRATNDIDVVIAPTAEELRELLREFPEDRYYADEEDALQSLAASSQFRGLEAQWRKALDRQ